jgi:hypothetical protein
MSKTTIVDIFDNAESTTETGESKEATTEEYTTGSDRDTATDTDTDNQGTEASQDDYERDPTSSDTTIISTEYTGTECTGTDESDDPIYSPATTGTNDTEPITVGSPMVVGGYADWTDSSEREPPAPHPDDKWRYN